MPISALIADDEASARSRLRKILAPYPFELLEQDARDGLEALEAIRKHRPQVVFLDVEMPGLGGFEVVESLTPRVMPLIVFVTAYDHYALAAFEANAVAYLLKPVGEERLQAMVSRVEQLLRSPDEAAQAASRVGVVTAREAADAASCAGDSEGWLRADPIERCLLFPGGGWRHACEDRHRHLSHQLRDQ